MNRLLIISLILLSANIIAQEKHVKIFPFKSAIIEYKYEAGLGGTHIKYIDDFGYKQADYIRKEIKIGDEVETKYETIILIGKRAYTADYQDSTIAIGANSTYSYYLNNENISSADINDALVRAEGFELVGTKEYLGKECKFWKAKKAKKLTWKGVELKLTISFMMMMVEKATSIKTDIDIPKGKFDLPDNLKYISSDVYQGYAGLELKFDEVKKAKTEDENSIKVNFSSSDLEDTSKIPFYTQEGDELIQEGDNDYNKIDYRIIKSQQWQLKSEETKLGKYSTLIFSQENGYGDGETIYGKVQINEISENEYSYRYIVFDKNEDLTGYSEDVNDALTRMFDIKISNNNLIFTPKNKTKCMVLGW
jgi:hypothetical protein